MVVDEAKARAESVRHLGVFLPRGTEPGSCHGLISISGSADIKQLPEPERKSLHIRMNFGSTYCLSIALAYLHAFVGPGLAVSHPPATCSRSCGVAFYAVATSFCFSPSVRV